MTIYWEKLLKRYILLVKEISVISFVGQKGIIIIQRLLVGDFVNQLISQLPRVFFYLKPKMLLKIKQLESQFGLPIVNF